MMKMAASKNYSWISERTAEIMRQVLVDAKLWVIHAWDKKVYTRLKYDETQRKEKKKKKNLSKPVWVMKANTTWINP